MAANVCPPVLSWMVPELVVNLSMILLKRTWMPALIATPTEPSGGDTAVTAGELVSTAAPVSDPNGELQHNAGVAALTWAKQFYAAHDVYLKGVDLKQRPAPYFRANFQGQVGNHEQVFFAIVLPDATNVEPALTAPTVQ